MPFSNPYLLAFFIVLFILTIPLERALTRWLPASFPIQQKLHVSRFATAIVLGACIAVSIWGGWLPADVFLFLWPCTKSALITTGVMLLISVLFTTWLRYRNIGSERPQDNLPFVRVGWLQYTLVWMLYLFIYETCMRGILMPWQTGPALGWLACNSLFYALVHLHRGRRETLGALLFGLVLGFVTLQVYSLLPAFAAHLVISVQMDIRPTFGKKG